MPLAVRPKRSCFEIRGICDWKFNMSAEALEHLSRREKRAAAGTPVEALPASRYQRNKRLTKSIRKPSSRAAKTVEWSTTDKPDQPLETPNGKRAMSEHATWSDFDSANGHILELQIPILHQRQTGLLSRTNLSSVHP